MQIHISQSKWTVTNLILQTISNYKFQRYLLEIKWSAHSQCQRIYSQKRKVLFIECKWSGETLLMANQAKKSDTYLFLNVYIHKRKGLTDNCFLKIRNKICQSYIS